MDFGQVNRRFLIGLDSGGAKTAAAICDPQGRVLARARAGGAAIVGLPDDRFFEVARACITRLCAMADVGLDQVARLAIGLSGVDYADEQLQQHAIIADRLGLQGRLELVNDGVVALWGVSAASNAALMQHGSGITTAYRRGGDEGSIFDSLDVAEVFDIRRAAFVQTARMIDGRAEPTSLRDRVLAHCGVTAREFAEWAFREPAARTKRFSVAAVVYEAWTAGDPIAARMVAAAAEDYVLAMRVMGQRIGAPFDAAFAGGVITQGGPAFQQLIGERLAREVPQARQVDVALPPELGALLLAGHSAGLDPRDLFAHLAASEPVS